MKRLLPFLLLVAACTTTETVVDRVEVPVPYWNPPENIQPLPQRALLQSQLLTPETAKEDTQQAFRAVAEDIRELIEENETIRYLYDQLVIRIKEVPDEPIDSPSR